MTAEPMPEDEFALLAENAEDAGLDVSPLPTVARRRVRVGDHEIAAIVWGEQPELVLLHGGAQNAHTWDTTALALRRSLAAIDLPGHGRSDWWPEGYDAGALGDAVTAAVRALAPRAVAAGGTGLGASVALHVADRLGTSVERLVVIDSTPGSGAHAPGDWRSASAAAAQVAEFTAHEEFPDFETMLDHATNHYASRAPRALRRGVFHNSVRTPQGTWRWRWDPAQRGATPVDPESSVRALTRFAGDMLVVRGEHSDIVTDDKVTQMRSQHPSLAVATVAGAGHSVQSDQPVALATLLARFLDRRR
jgi:pimeloyl-ACP methyl ester carboxylesterase